MKTGPKPRPLEDRFWDMVAFIGASPDGCWPWDGATNKGQGQFGLRKGKSVRAHRLAYELVKGPIPAGLTIDHLCCNKICCNPKHLEAVTTQVNTRRWGDTITHCPEGHEYTPENTIHNTKGWRKCRACRNEQRKRFGDYHKRPRRAAVKL